MISNLDHGACNATGTPNSTCINDYNNAVDGAYNTIIGYWGSAFSSSSIGLASMIVEGTRRFGRPLLRFNILPLLAMAMLMGASQASAANEQVLWNFVAFSADGMSPNGGLIVDSSGDLYGTTFGGGNNGAGTEVGTIFKLTPGGQESILWNFGLVFDGQLPQAGLIMDQSGNLFGTTSDGGLYFVQGGAAASTVFKLTPEGQECNPLEFRQRRRWRPAAKGADHGC